MKMTYTQISNYKRSICFGFIIWVFFIIGSFPLLAQKTPAFPGAEGFGKYAEGGRGGEIIKVTNLEDSGEGSLRYALESEGPRIIVFEVGGLIDLKTPIVIESPYVTIAGQTAPGDGIAIRGNGIRIRSHDIIMRFLRIRPGDISFGPANSWEHLDALNLSKGNNGSKVFNVIIDHCSLSWATDEVFNIGRDIFNVTIQNSIIAEGLRNSKHPKGQHSKGILVRSETDSISILNNFMTHNVSRNPKINTAGLVDIRNNVVYNPGAFGATFVNMEDEIQKINLVNNIFTAGLNTEFEQEISIYNPEEYNGRIFMEDNIGFEGDKEKDGWSMLVKKNTTRILGPDLYNSFKTEKEFPNNGAKNKSETDIKRYINSHIGASLPIRDQVDERLIKEFNNKKGRITDSPGKVGGWPTYLNGLSSVDDQNNGIPDSWMERYGIEVGEEHRDFDNDGYSNIEEYVNGTDPTNANNSEEDIFSTNSGSGGMGILESMNFELEQNFPNPFRSRTKIRFDISGGSTEIYIYNSIGQKVKTLLDRNLSPGEYELNWKPDQELSSGTFFLKVIHEGKVQTMPMTYIK